jgi:hypothetical protein
MNNDAVGSIVCIAWGSLVWDSRELPCGPWHDDGPSLPVEFVRESSNRRITLVIHLDAPRFQTLWSVLDVPDLRSAMDKLGAREYDRAGPKWIEKNIGVWNGSDGSSRGREAHTIAAWARPRGFAGVVWTDLPPKFGGLEGAVPSRDEVLAYLDALSGAERDEAEKYVRRAPAQINTPYRQRIGEMLGWTYRS